MIAGDYLVRATAARGSIRAFALRTTETVNEAQRRHSLYPVATAALGRTMTVGLVFGAMQKGEETITLQLRGDGPLKGIMVSADATGKVRGYVNNPRVELPLNSQGKLAVGEALGRGNLWVIRDMGLKEPYQGTVPLQTGEIGDDFAYYFAHSEQTPAVVSVGVLVNPDYSCKAAGGYVIQVMPAADHTVITDLEKRLPHLPSISRQIEAGRLPEELLYQVLGDFELEIKEKRSVGFACPCSKQRFADGLVALGEDELAELAKEEEELELICHFCEEHYYFATHELRELLGELQKG